MLAYFHTKIRRTSGLPYKIPDSMVEELGEWSGGAEIPLETWVGNEGNFKLAIGYVATFWPKFVAVGKYILVEGRSAENILSFENQ